MSHFPVYKATKFFFFWGGGGGEGDSIFQKLCGRIGSPEELPHGWDKTSRNFCRKKDIHSLVQEKKLAQISLYSLVRAARWATSNFAMHRMATLSLSLSSPLPPGAPHTCQFLAMVDRDRGKKRAFFYYPT